MRECDTNTTSNQHTYFETPSQWGFPHNKKGTSPHQRVRKATAIPTLSRWLIGQYFENEIARTFNKVQLQEASSRRFLPISIHLIPAGSFQALYLDVHRDLQRFWPQPFRTASRTRYPFIPEAAHTGLNKSRRPPVAAHGAIALWRNAISISPDTNKINNVPEICSRAAYSAVLALDMPDAKSVMLHPDANAAGAGHNDFCLACPTAFGSCSRRITPEFSSASAPTSP